MAHLLSVRLDRMIGEVKDLIKEVSEHDEKELTFIRTIKLKQGKKYNILSTTGNCKMNFKAGITGTNKSKTVLYDYKTQEETMKELFKAVKSKISRGYVCIYDSGIPEPKGGIATPADPESSKKFGCQICDKIARDPHVNPCCYKFVYCKQCVLDDAENPETSVLQCPVCQTKVKPLTLVPLPKEMASVYSELVYRCPQFGFGAKHCKFSGKLEALDEHYYGCSHGPYQLLQCDASDCQRYYYKKDAVKHMKQYIVNHAVSASNALKALDKNLEELEKKIN